MKHYSRHFLLACGLLLALSLAAVPARQVTKTYTQSDGSNITVTFMGDEWLSAFVTDDGLTVSRAQNGDFYYRGVNGTTSTMAHNSSQRSAAEHAFVAANRSNMTMGALASLPSYQSIRNSARMPRRVGTTQVPTTGSPRIPILLVQFSDKPMANQVSTFEAQYTAGNSSAYKYFYDQSHGVYQPQFDVYGIYTLPNTRATYGAHGTRPDGKECNDVGVAAMVCDGIEQAGDDIDWSLYDNDGDGQVDVCIVVYAGVGEAQAYGIMPDAVWPCQWNLYSGWYYGDGTGPAYRNNVTIDRFAVFNELTGSNDNGTAIDGVGTFCHEFSHCLGLPDFYETTYANDYYGMGSWSLMCSGCYNNDGYTPCGYTAYEKNFMGWMDLVEPMENTKYTLSDITQEDAQAVKITNPQNSDEYYILENRQQTGWNAYMQSKGLMVTHVTYNATAWARNAVNNDMPQRMTIIPADNKLSGYNEYGDLYPYRGNNSLTDNSTPAAALNTGQSFMGQPVTEITQQSNGKVSFWYMKGVITKEVPELNEVDDSTITNTSFTITWNAVNYVQSYELQLCNLATGLTFSVTDITDTQATVDQGLEEGETYTVKVRVHYTDDTVSDWSEAVMVTLKESLVLYPANEDLITETGFTAEWKAMKQGNTFDLQVVKAGASVAVPKLHESFAQFTTTSGTNISGSLDDYMDHAGWTGTYLYSYQGGLRMGGPNTKASSLKSPAIDFSDGDGQITIMGKALAYYASAGDCTLTIIASGQQSTATIPAGTEQEFAVVLDCPASDAVKVGFATAKGKPLVIKSLTFCSGDGTIVAPAGAPAVTGDATMQMIEGITTTSYAVTGLQKGGTYFYRLRMLRYDGSYTSWTDLQRVKLHGSILMGDVNGDGVVDVQDVSTLIDYILGKTGITFVIEAADVNGDGNIDVQDVSGVIDIALE